MRHHHRVAAPVRELHRLDRLGERPDLVHLDEDRVRHAALDALLKSLRVRHEEVVADELDTLAELLRQRRPRVPVVLRAAVLDRHDGIAVDDAVPESRQLVRGEIAPFEPVAAVREHLARRRVERDRDPLAVACLVGRLEDRLDRRLARVEVGREATLVAHAGREASLVEHLLQRVIHLGADSECLCERVGTGRNQHELLQVDRVRRVHAAVDHVQHRHRERRRLLAAEVAKERLPRVCRRRLRRRERDAEDRVRAEPALVRGAVELDQPAVESGLLRRLHAEDGAADLAACVRDRLRDALAAPGRVAVAQLDRLVHARRRSRRNRGPTRGTRLEPHVDLDGRVPPRIEDLSGQHVGDAGHSASFARSK